jgi:hypothetical protein
VWVHSALLTATTVSQKSEAEIVPKAVLGNCLSKKLQQAISYINEAGVLLVYPINNQKDPASLWSKFYPRSEMRWEWDSGGDNRVANLWYLREELSRSREVVYSKWFQGRATFFSRQVFAALLRLRAFDPILSRQAEEILQILNEDSPLSTKEIKAATDLRGRSLESAYTKAMKELWLQMLIVGYGEKDDGAFPSLAVGATKTLFEDLWQMAEGWSEEKAHSIVTTAFNGSPRLQRFLNKTSHIKK